MKCLKRHELNCSLQKNLLNWVDFRKLLNMHFIVMALSLRLLKYLFPTSRKLTCLALRNKMLGKNKN